MQAGRAYLVLVMKGQLNLSATNVTLSSTVVDDEQNVVNSFEEWYFDDKLTPVGKWQASFSSISDVEAGPSSQSAPSMRAAALPGTYKTMLEKFNQQGTNAGEDGSQDEMDYEGDIPFTESAPSGIQPIIRTIDADGTNRYFDLQGRMLNGKPDKGMFIENGKKMVK